MDWLAIAGLGNPGAKYEGTRHNIGFSVIDLLASKHHLRVTDLKHRAFVCNGCIENKKVLLIKPQTFMNLSGESLREVVSWYKIPLSNLTVVYDDIDLDLGKLRIRPRGSAGTHNGMRSILYSLGSEDFQRVRVGVGKPKDNEDLVSYVTGKFYSHEIKTVNEISNVAVEALEEMIKQGIEKCYEQIQ